MRSTQARRLREPSSLRLLANERGAVNLLLLVFLAAAGLVAYFGYAYLPHWMRNREVVAAMREAGYQSWRQTDDQLLDLLLRRTDELIVVDDGDGPYPAIDESMVQLSREGKTIRIELEYEVPMKLPWIETVREIRFANVVEADSDAPTRR